MTPRRVRVVAVTKGFGPDAVTAARAAGLHDIGRELRRRAGGQARCRASTGRRRAGTSRRRPAQQGARVGPAGRLCGRAWPAWPRGSGSPASRPGPTVLVQVDCTGLRRAATAARRARSRPWSRRSAALGLDVRGLMTVAPRDRRRGRRAFVRGGGPPGRPLGLPERSMGMSDDLEAAVAAGIDHGADRAGPVRRAAAASPRCCVTWCECSLPPGRAGTTLCRDRRRHGTLVHEENHGLPRPARRRVRRVRRPRGPAPARLLGRHQPGRAPRRPSTTSPRSTAAA